MNHPALSPCILRVCFSSSLCDKEQSTRSRQTDVRVRQEKLNPYSGQVDCLHTAPYRPITDGACHAPTYRMTLTQKARRENRSRENSQEAPETRPEHGGLWDRLPRCPSVRYVLCWCQNHPGCREPPPLRQPLPRDHRHLRAPASRTRLHRLSVCEASQHP